MTKSGHICKISIRIAILVSPIAIYNQSKSQKIKSIVPDLSEKIMAIMYCTSNPTISSEIL